MRIRLSLNDFSSFEPSSAHFGHSEALFWRSLSVAPKGILESGSILENVATEINEAAVSGSLL